MKLIMAMVDDFGKVFVPGDYVLAFYGEGKRPLMRMQGTIVSITRDYFTISTRSPEDDSIKKVKIPTASVRDMNLLSAVRR